MPPFKATHMLTFTPHNGQPKVFVAMLVDGTAYSMDARDAEFSAIIKRDDAANETFGGQVTRGSQLGTWEVDGLRQEPGEERIEPLRTAVARATDQWTGLPWDNAPRALVEVLEVLTDEAALDLNEIDVHGTWWKDDGSAESQSMCARWTSMLEALRTGLISADLIVEARSFAADVAANAEADANAASAYGRRAIEAAKCGLWEDAVAELEKASMLEQFYGHEPAWADALALACKLASGRR